MSRATVALGGALALSVAANAWLLAHDSGPRTSPRPGAHAAAIEGDRAPAPVAAARGGPAVAPATSCEASLTATRGRVEHLSKELEHHRHMEDRFAAAPRSPAHERVLGDELARVWTGAPAWMKWQVECHGLVCVIDLDRDDGDPTFDWTRKVQADITPGLTNGMSFGSVDPKTEEPYDHPRFYVALAEPGDFPGAWLLDRIDHTFENGDAEEDCAKRDPTAGTLDVELTVDPVARTIGVTPRGSLAGTSAARCLLDALAAVIAEDPVPLNATAATSHLIVTMR